MKIFSLILLFFSTYSFAMELDQTALQEFLSNKKQMIVVSEGKVDVNNPLFKRYSELSRLDPSTIIQEYAKPSVRGKVISFYNWLSNKPEYQSALAAARKANTDEQWNKFRKGNGHLIQGYFDQNGIKTVTSSCADFFNANAHLNAEQIEKVVAQSFVIYYIRQLQRNQSPVMPSAINIT